MMCERPKIHVFLGAPPPSSEVRGRPPADFNHLKLTWQDGHLQPATAEADQDDPRADWARDHSGSDGLSPEASASACEYLDSSFPEEHQPAAAAKSGLPRLSEQTQYLSTWTLSQALMLRARRGSQSAASPEKTLQSQTVPTDAQKPSAASSSTPELFSPVPLSMEASGELFTQPFLSPGAEQGAVVIQATPDGVLCSQEAVQAPLLSRQSPDCKKARMAEKVEGEVSEAPTGDRSVAASRRPTTLLVRCGSEGVAYTVLVAVVHPCHLKEVKVSGEVCTCGHQGAPWCSDQLIGKMLDAADQVWTSGGDPCPFGIHCCY